MAIENAIASRLTAIVVTASHYLRVVPEGKAHPIVQWQMLFSERESAMGDDTGLVAATYQFTVYASSIASEKAVKAELRTAFQRFRGTLDGTEIQAVFLVDERDEYNDILKEHVKVLDFKFWYLE